jgi:hypothetical protein
MMGPIQTPAPVRSEGIAAETLQVLLDSVRETPIRSGGPGEILLMVWELYQLEDPILRFVLLLFGLLIGIPVMGGLLIILYRWTKVDTSRPPSTFSYIPFVGTALEYSWNPVTFLQKQHGLKGDIISLDVIFQQSYVLLGTNGVQDWTRHNSPSLSRLAYLAEKLDFSSNYIHVMQEYWDLVPEYFKTVESQLVESLLRQTVEDVSHTQIGLFPLVSHLYLHVMVAITLGDKVGAQLTDELYLLYLGLGSDYMSILEGVGLPSSRASLRTNIVKKLEAWIKQECKDPPKGTYLEFLCSEKHLDYAAHHIIHVILACFSNCGTLC